MITKKSSSRRSQIQSTLIVTLFLLLAMLYSCTVEPQPINYGQDNCHFCNMTVVDKSHASEYVTKKGKSYPFDAIECLVMDINKSENEKELAYILVADYAHPGQLVDAKVATYLVSEAIKSPMGANLSAFESKEDAINTQKEKGGTLYTWDQIKQKLHK